MNAEVGGNSDTHELETKLESESRKMVLDGAKTTIADVPNKDVSNYVWEGWYAALIHCKQGNVKRGVDQDRKVVTVQWSKKLHLGKRKDRRTLNAKERYLSADKALQFGLWSVAIRNRKCRSKVRKIAKAVAALTIRGMHRVCWHKLEELFSPEVYETVWHRVFCSTAKFVLSIFDMEDFMRIDKMLAIHKEYAEFCSDLQRLESSADPFEAIAEGKIDLKKFSILREHDVGKILKIYHNYSKFPNFEVYPWVFRLRTIEFDDVSQSDSNRAFTEMCKYMPLKEHLKMQLILELTVGNSCHVLDTLIVEAWKYINYKKLFKYFVNTFDDDKQDYFTEFKDPVLHDGAFPYDLEPSEMAKFELERFVCDLKRGLIFLAELKQSSLLHFQIAATFPLTCNVFGDFSKEVLEVVWIANHERSLQGHRFISVTDILFGLSLSRVADCVQRILNVRQNDLLAQGPSDIPIYLIYKVAGDAARNKGDKDVRLEHLVLAIFSVKWDNGRPCPSEKTPHNLTLTYPGNDHWDDELFQSLRTAKTEFGVIWKDSGLTYLPKECFDGTRMTCDDPISVRRLADSFESGLKLPAIRVPLH